MLHSALPFLDGVGVSFWGWVSPVACGSATRRDCLRMDGPCGEQNPIVCGVGKQGGVMARAKLGDRSLFPDLEAFAYVNHSAISPLSAPVQAAMAEVTADYGRRGLDAYFTWSERREGLRERLARLMGAEASSVAFVPNTTHGVLYTALCFPWKRGDRVVLFEGEFPTNVTPWQSAAREYGLELVFLSAQSFVPGGDGLEQLERELSRGVRLVAVSAVQFQTGLRMPLAEISALCKGTNTQVFVDAIQAIGCVPLDVGQLGVDYLACGSHKWLMGPEGAGFLYVAPGRAEELVPRCVGWLSHEEPISFLLEGAGHLRYNRAIRRSADFVEMGASNTVGLAALDVSVSLLEEIGIASIYKHINLYLDALEVGLLALGFESLRAPVVSGRSGILSLRPPARCASSLGELGEALREKGVSCSTPDGLLRFAPHWPNHHDEVARVVEAVSAVVSA